MAIINKFGDAKDIVELLLKRKKKNTNEQQTNLEMVNIMLAGKTGVGKSTIINAVFGQDFAPTGIGAPVTQNNFTMYEKEEIPLRIYDVRGFELNPSVQKTLPFEMKKLIRTSLKTDDRNDDIHLLWYCVSSEGKKFEDFEANFIKDLANLIDVVIVVTQSVDDNITRELIGYIENKCADIPIKVVVPVLAFDKEVDGTVVKEGFGITALADLSYELLPDAQRRAFSAAQQVSDELRKKAAYTAITFATAAAGAVGAIPIPIADAAILVPIQSTMFMGVANAYGLGFKEDDFTKLTSLIAPVIAVQGGKAAVVSLLKLVAGVNIAASAISGTVAASMTFALGSAFRQALESGLNNMQINGAVVRKVSEIIDNNFAVNFKEAFISIFNKKLEK